MNDAVRWLRIVLTLLLLWLGVRAFADELGTVPIVSAINVAIHETGHYLFMPFGELMMIAGGSIFQVLVPLVFTGYFLFRKDDRRDPHAASVCFWWAAINLLSVSIYAADARDRDLMLLSGGTGQDDPDGHDFYNIFAHLGVLNNDRLYAARIRGLAMAAFVVSIGAGLWTALWVRRAGNAMPPTLSGRQGRVP